MTPITVMPITITPAQLKSFLMWLLSTIGGSFVSWVARLWIWKLFIKDKPELEMAPQP